MTETLEADFVVVGAGFAGLTAAWRLTHHATPPASVIVLEARERVGGRVWTEMLDDGAAWADMGGTWFGPGQDYSYDLAKEMKVATYPTYKKGNSLLIIEGQKPVRSIEDFPCAGLFAAGVGLALLAELESMAEQVPLDAPWTAKHAREWDRQTFAAWVASQTSLDSSMTPAATALATIFSGLFCSDPSEISLLDALYLVHSHGGFVRLMAVEGGNQQDRIVGGAQHIANAMKEKLGDAVRLNEPVRKIAQDATGVTVTATNVTVRAKRVIVTIPPALAGYVEYEPELPAERAQLQQRAPYGAVLKVLVKYDTPFWRKNGLSGQSFALTHPVGATYDGCTDKDDTPGLLIAFAFGSHARAFDRMGKEERQQRIVDELAHRFGDEARAVRWYHEVEWAQQRWTRGGIFAHFPSGVLTTFGATLKEPCGFIHWAGTETSSAFHGSINGAIESGMRAAEEVIAATRGASH
ncbi:MAG TPA: FAD-dependent oxidoreductase [Thermoanaerobaculia bacterium]|nr:FAD-dependent oxidoreductase [Thermoanaerobaculia bacterium]